MVRGPKKHRESPCRQTDTRGLAAKQCAAVALMWNRQSRISARRGPEPCPAAIMRRGRRVLSLARGCNDDESRGLGAGTRAVRTSLYLPLPLAY